MNEENLPEFMNRVLREGEPFELYITLTTTTAGTFTLDSTAWDWNGDGVAEAAPFTSKMLVITGMSLEATIVGGSVFNYLTIDGIECTPLDWYNLTLAASTTVKWDGMEKASGNGWHWPMLTDHWCVPLVCRQAISVKLSSVGQGGDSIVLRFRGYAIDRQY